MPEVIANEIQAELLKTRPPVGSHLPTESELSSEYDVSRTVIREAARILENRGLVSVRPGRGMTVSQVDATPIVEHYSLLLASSPTTFNDLMDVRLLVETHLAGLAAESRSPFDLDELKNTILVLEDDSRAFDEHMDADIRFHELVGRASGNPLMSLIVEPINECLRQSYLIESEYTSRLPATIAEHEAILEAISERDASKATSAATAHLLRIRENSTGLWP